MVQVGAKPSVEISVAGGPNIETKYTKFEWASFVNGGYVIKGEIDDSWWNTISNLATNSYLREGRIKAVPITFSILWDENRRTTKRTALLTELEASGKGDGGDVTFVGVDPPSYFLNSGDASGRHFEGRVSDVIQQVVSLYAPEIQLEITQTEDNVNNSWWMMRQDPKTFIKSLLDWSSAIVPDKTSWIVASTDFKLVIREQSEFRGRFFGNYDMNAAEGAKDIEDVDFLGNSMLTPIQTNLRTAGISTTTGRIFTDVAVNDENTTNKRNVDIGPTQGFKKPPPDIAPGAPGGATYITSIPEFSGGEIGLSYENYIDGRARGLFMNMLNMVMRIKITIDGDHTIDDSELLGVSSLNINWINSDSEVYFLGGRWLVYGFHHVCKPRKWVTHLYLARLDFDANAKSVE